MAWGTFNVSTFNAREGGQRRGAYIRVAFTLSADAAGAKVGLFQICRPRKRMIGKTAWVPFYSHGGTGLTTAVNGFFIDNEGNNSPLYKMQQDNSVAKNDRLLISSAKPNYVGDAQIGLYGTQTAEIADQPMRTVTDDIDMVIQDFETVALVLTQGQDDAVYPGKVLSSLSWGYIVERNRTVRLLGPSVVAKPRPEVKSLCELWNSGQPVKIPNVDLMQCRSQPPDPAPRAPERGSLRRL